MTERKNILLGKFVALPFFDGVPYLVTKLVGAMRHIILLPADWSAEELRRLARRQIKANKLPTRLVIEPGWVLYLEPDGGEYQETEPPRGGLLVTGKLKAAQDFPETGELRRRMEALELFMRATQPQSGYVVGDPSQGDRPASKEERRRLKGKQENGIPKGLRRCPRCSEWRGECLIPARKYKTTLIRVCCRCENDNLCACCGRPLADRKLNANHYDESDGRIWHVPGFCCLDHLCRPSGKIKKTLHFQNTQGKGMLSPQEGN
jgi:hypothetical protein